jgi:hypothetical protein
MNNNIKTCMALILLATVSISAQAQFPYEGSVFTEEYVSLQDPTLLDIEIGWDDPELLIPLPFTFSFGNIQAFEMNLGGTGEMLFTMDEIGNMNILWPLSLDVMDVSNSMNADPEDVSTIGYETQGNEPNRIFKMEWNNCGLYDEIDEFGTADIRVNWQVWLHESSGIIEYRFGPTTLTEEDILSLLEGYPLTSAIVLNFDYEGYSGDIYFAAGDATAPTWSMDTDFYNWYYSGESLTNAPQEGTGYRFNGTSTFIAEAEVVNNAFQLFPNPATSTCVVSNLKETEQQYVCLSVAGTIVDQWTLSPQATQRLDVSGFAPGLYVIQTDQGASQKLMIH